MSLRAGRMDLADPHRPWTIAERASLAKEITTTYIWARRRIRRTSVDQAAVAAREGRAAAQRDDRPNAEYQVAWRLARIVERRLSQLPGDTRCLTRSVVLVRMLARRGMDAMLVIGARSQPEFAAHAWVELDGHPLLDPLDYQAGRLTEV